MLVVLVAACATGRPGLEDRGRADHRADHAAADSDGSALLDGPQVDLGRDGPRADLPRDLPLSPDKKSPDLKSPDQKLPDSGGGELCANGVDDDKNGKIDCVDLAACGSKAPCTDAARTFVIYEVYCGQPDYLVLRNVSTTSRNLAGFVLEMNGTDPVTYTLPSKTVPAGGLVWIFENSAGTQADDLNTGANIPFYDAVTTVSNAVVLKTSGGQVVDYVGFGAALVSLPSGATQSGGPVSYVGFNVGTDSHYRAGMKGASPTFYKADWVAYKKSR